jgi:UDP-2,3-diacylglucosamine pyrophosphatase LpxH
LHLGSPICQTDLLEAFLSTLPETKYLILNGDVLQGTEKRLSKSHWRVLSLLRKLSDKTSLVWCGGNHDLDADAVAHLIGATFTKPGFVVDSGSSRCLCVHGDQWDDFIARRPLLSWLADKAHLLVQRLSPVMAHFMKRSSKTFLRNCERVREGALAYAYSRGWEQIVCCGHTHKAERFECHDGVVYLNSGCWTEPVAHYISLKDGEATLNSFKGN